MYQELIEIIKELADTHATLGQFYQNAQFESRLGILKNQADQEQFWQHPDRISISQEIQELEDICTTYCSSTQELSDLKELAALFADDSQEINKLYITSLQLRKKLNSLKITLLLNEPSDTKNCFLTITPGAGGTESQDWASMLLRMYLRFCESQNWTAQAYDYQAGEEAGIKSATLFIKGKNTYGQLKAENGIHRLVRISPFDANKRRHTSFAGVTVIAEVEEAKVNIKPDDLRIDTYKSSGAGGQHVNTTDSAVRITHLPSGVVVQCQNERSQLQNKVQCMKMLAARLYELEEEKRRQSQNAIEKKKIEWGSQIRSYVLHPYKMVKDHRTNFESGQPDKVLDGDLEDFIEQFLILRPDKQND